MPEGRDLIFLLLGIIGIGTSGPLIAMSAMPIVTLVFWRNLGGAILISPFAYRARRTAMASQEPDELRRFRSGVRWSILAGVEIGRAHV